MIFIVFREALNIDEANFSVVGYGFWVLILF